MKGIFNLLILSFFVAFGSFAQQDKDTTYRVAPVFSDSVKYNLKEIDSLNSELHVKIDSLKASMDRLKQIMDNTHWHLDSISEERNRPFPDSVQKFIDQIGNIELVKLIPDCEKRRVFIDSLNRKKTVTYCHTQSAIDSNFEDGQWTYTLNERVIGERVELKSQYRENLLKAIFPSRIGTSLTMCYEPRHGVYFYTKENTLLGFFEICFECSRSEPTSTVPAQFILPHSSYEKLHLIFDEHDLIDLRK